MDELWIGLVLFFMFMVVGFLGYIAGKEGDEGQ